jgi:hypothetical protein
VRTRLGALLFPDPPRPIPAHRPLGIALRTAHLMCFGTLVGGHVFDVEAPRLFPFLIATIATGVALMALELVSSCVWLFTGKGVMVLAKLLLLLTIPVFWEHRVALLLATVVVASVSSHMPSRFRHYSFLPRRRAGPVESPLQALPAGRAGGAAGPR